MKPLPVTYHCKGKQAAEVNMIIDKTHQVFSITKRNYRNNFN